MQRKHSLSESEVESLRQELEEAKADRAKFLESSTYIINKLRQEVCEMTRSYVETKLADREQFEAELAELKKNSATASRNLPEAAHLLNQLKAKRRKSTVSLADVETLLEIMKSPVTTHRMDFRNHFPLSKGAFLAQIFRATP